MVSMELHVPANLVCTGLYLSGPDLRACMLLSAMGVKPPPGPYLGQLGAAPQPALLVYTCQSLITWIHMV